MLVTLLCLAVAPAHAEDASIELYLQGSPTGGVGTGLGGRLEAGMPFVAVEAFGMSGGDWLGRATVGLDLFGKSDRFDLTLGLYLGSTGNWLVPSLSKATVTAGGEFGIGGRIGPLGARFRHLDGFRGPLEARLTQDELRVGWNFGERVEIFAQYVRFNPGEGSPIGGYGAGGMLRF